jgi:hypothetical protein
VETGLRGENASLQGESGFDGKTVASFAERRLGDFGLSQCAKMRGRPF